MTGVQRAYLVGTVLWLVSHGPLVALLSLPEHERPWLSVLALVVVLGVSALAVRPLRGGPLDLSVPAAVGMAAVVPLSGLAIMPFLDEHLWRTYANYWPGLTQILVVALVMRRRWVAGLAAELASAAVLGVFVLTSSLPNREVAFAALNQPAIVWFTAALGVRFLFDRTARDVARFEADESRAVVARASTQAREASARQRREDLEQDVVPLLRRVAADSPGDGLSWSGLSRAALAVERRVRDDLRARELVDDRVRTALRHARDRGAVVDVLNDRGTAEDPRFVSHVRGVLAPVLQACGTARVTVRLPPGAMATIAVDGLAEDVAAVAAVLHAGSEGLYVIVDVVSDEEDASLWADLRSTDQYSSAGQH